MVFCNCPFCEFRIKYRRALLHQQGGRELGMPDDYSDGPMRKLMERSPDLWSRMSGMDADRTFVLAELVRARASLG